jgi:peptidoglycan DL-endopeptidase LytE
MFGLCAVATLLMPSVALADAHVVSKPVVSAQKVVSNGVTYHTVKAGESLWSIARKYGVSVKTLERLNHLTDHSTLRIGQRLVIHYGAQSTSSSKKLAGRAETSVDDSSGAVFGMQIVQYAAQFLGAPYRYGGRSPSGFDCSGLVQFTFGHFGISLARDSYSQATEGVPVSRDQLQPGDLVFFNTYGPGASHVGIYAGGGRFINAASSRVQYDSLYDAYWSNHFLFGRRVR